MASPGRRCARSAHRRICLRHRSCERSEAIHIFLDAVTMDCFAALAMTAEDIDSHSRGALRPRFAFLCPLRNRGRREDRVRAAPAVPCAICAKKTAHEHTGQRRASGLPCAMALRLISCSPRRTALLPPSPARGFASRELDASTAASGPHDFAVRSSCARQSQLSRPPHPTPRRDDRQRPSSGETGGVMRLICVDERKQIFLIPGLDTISENRK